MHNGALAHSIRHGVHNSGGPLARARAGRDLAAPNSQRGRRCQAQRLCARGAHDTITCTGSGTRAATSNGQLQLLLGLPSSGSVLGPVSATASSPRSVHTHRCKVLGHSPGR
jgi:hypothetical protein